MCWLREVLDERLEVKKEGEKGERRRKGRREKERRVEIRTRGESTDQRGRSDKQPTREGGRTVLSSFLPSLVPSALLLWRATKYIHTYFPSFLVLVVAPLMPLDPAPSTTGVAVSVALARLSASLTITRAFFGCNRPPIGLSTL